MSALDGVGFVRIAKRVRAHLAQDHRYGHTLRVARTAAALARAYGIDVTQARLAGLLHDLARLYSHDRLLRECTERGMPIDAFERANPIVLHARLGAELARDDYGISDHAVLAAIARHTVGAADMSPLDTAVFLADALEPGRSFAGRAEQLALAFHDPRTALRINVESSRRYLSERGLEVAPQMLALAKTLAREEKRSA